MKTLIALAWLLAACHQTDAGAGKTETVPLGKTGFVLDVRKGSEVNESPNDVFRITSPKTAEIAHFYVSVDRLGTLDDAVKRNCGGRSDLEQGSLPGGGTWMTCVGKTELVSVTYVLVRVPIDQHSAFNCTADQIDDLVRPVLAICKTIRKG
jgi:hypothetical protein